MATIACQFLPRPQLNPVLVTLRYTLAVFVEHTDSQRRIGRHLDHDRAVWFDHRVTDDLAHTLLRANAEIRVIEIDHIVVGNRYSLFDSQKARESIFRERLHRVRSCRNIDNRQTIKVVHAANIQYSFAIGSNRRVQGKQIPTVGDFRRRQFRVGCHHLGEHEAFFTRHNWQLRVIARIVHPDAEQRWCQYKQRVGQACISAGHDVLSQVRQYFDNSTLGPADQ